jgi:hypothetical protein
MPEALIYRLHRLFLLINVLPVALTAALLRSLIFDVAFAIIILVSVGLFLLAYLGEERSYTGAIVLGAIQIVGSTLMAINHGTWIYSLPADAFGILLFIAGAGTSTRYGKAKKKKALQEFVPPAFG